MAKLMQCLRRGGDGQSLAQVHAETVIRLRMDLALLESALADCDALCEEMMRQFRATGAASGSLSGDLAERVQRVKAALAAASSVTETAAVDKAEANALIGNLLEDLRAEMAYQDGVMNQDEAMRQRLRNLRQP